MSDRNTSLKVVIITATLTTLITSLVGTWVPNLFTKVYDWVSNEPIFIVEVYDNQQPVKGVKVAVSLSTTDVVLDSGTTDESGSLKLKKVTTGTLAVEASLEEGLSYIRKYRKFHRIESFPHVLTLDRNKDFFQTSTNIALVPSSQASPNVTPSQAGNSPTPHITTSPTEPSQNPVITVPTPGPRSTPPNPQAVLQSLNVQYGKPLLTADRQVRARLEIDWVEGTPLPELEARMSVGTVRIEDLLREVGIQLEVVRSNQLPVSVLGADDVLDLKEMKDTMNSFRNEVRPGIWHFYLIVAKKIHLGTSSLLFDDKQRMGAAIAMDSDSSDPKYSDPRYKIFQVIHELGHMLNLPHPWQTYGDSKSVMTYPYRWQDWSWDEPQVYRFDAFGQSHIRRAPDDYVMPSGSAFLDYGTPMKWLGFK